MKNDVMSVNALKGATFISTFTEYPAEFFAAMCVNALKGATFISTKSTAIGAGDMQWLCQCPERGDLHFYVMKKG